MFCFIKLGIKFRSIKDFKNSLWKIIPSEKHSLKMFTNTSKMFSKNDTLNYIIASIICTFLPLLKILEGCIFTIPVPLPQLMVQKIDTKYRKCPETLMTSYTHKKSFKSTMKKTLQTGNQKDHLCVREDKIKQATRTSECYLHSQKDLENLTGIDMFLSILFCQGMELVCLGERGQERKKSKQYIQTNRQSVLQKSMSLAMCLLVLAQFKDSSENSNGMQYYTMIF